MSPRRVAATCLAGALTAALLATGPSVAQASGGAPSVESAVAGPQIIDLPAGTCLRAIPEGLVRLDGPADTRLVARARRTADGVQLSIIGGSGRLGGVVVGPRDVAGDLELKGGRLSGDVTFHLTAHPKVVETWHQTVRVSAYPRDCDWGGTVALSAEGEGASLKMRGPLADDGTFFLRGSGTVSMARTAIPISGWMRSGERASWLVTGTTGKEVRLPGARIADISVRLSEARPLVTGTATIGLVSPRLSARSRLEIVGSGTWKAFAEGSRLASWTMPNAGGLAVQTGQLAGSIGMSSGKPDWDLRAPARVDVAPLRMTALVGFTGPSTYSVRVTRATGGVLGFPADHVFLGGESELTVTPRKLSGALSVQAPGELLVDLTGNWRGVTQYLLVPGRGRGWSFTPAVSHVLRTGIGAMRFAGPIDARGGVRLRVGGDIDIAGTKVPVRGYYMRDGFGAGSVPVWSIAAYLDEVPGGIALKGGASLGGGAMAIEGPGAQPIETIEAWLLAQQGAAPGVADDPPSRLPRGGAPGKPTGVTASVDSTATVTIKWTAPGDTGNSPINYYDVEVSATGHTVCSQVKSTSCKVAYGKLADGTYSFKVRATNTKMTVGSWSDASNSVTIAKPPTSSGSYTLSLPESGDDTFALPATYEYWDADTWTVTVAGTTTTNLYKPFEGLSVPEKDFSGTIKSVDGVQTWNVTIGVQQWDDLAKGVDFSGSFSVGNTCPLGDKCPGIDGIYLSGTSQMDFQDTSMPDVSTSGAFLSDGSWARWDATASPVVFHGITISEPDFTMWKGERNDTDPNLVLPDLSDLNGRGLSMEFCGDFKVPIPDLSPLTTRGCAEWSDDGVVMGQINTGGDVATGSYVAAGGSNKGVTLGGVTLSGYAWNEFDDEQTIFLNGQEVVMEKGKDYLTAAVVIPGTLMEDFGTGKATDTMIQAQGWFTPEGDFDFTGSIPVNVKGSGVTLKEITVEISRDHTDTGTEFALRLDAICDVALQGNHFPLDIYIGYKKDTDAHVTVGFSATGTQSPQSTGTMDFVNLVPSGDFEPPNAALMDGTFDGRLPSNIANDGGFERLTDPGEIVPNAGFEDGVGENVVDNPGFEDGKSSNLLANGDFEQTDLLVNGDFEENGGSLLGWQAASGVTASTTPGYTTSGTEGGDTVVSISVSASGSKGITQTIPLALGGYGISVGTSYWTQSGGTGATLSVTGNGCSTAWSISGKGAADDTWMNVTAAGTVGSGCTSLTVSVAPTGSGSMLVDDVTFAITSTPTAITVPTVWRPGIVANFDTVLSEAPLMKGYSSGLSVNDGVLKSTSNKSWLLYSSSGLSTAGDFDASYRIYFPQGGATDVEWASFGFRLSGDYSSAAGSCFRVASNTDLSSTGGFFSCGVGKTSSLISGARGMPHVNFNTWYRVRLTAVGSRVTAYVTKDATGDLVFTDTVTIDNSAGGMFGQLGLGGTDGAGFYWDDITVTSLQNPGSNASATNSPVRVWYGSGAAHSGSGRASLITTSWGDQEFQYSTGETPAAGGTYTYSAWVRAASGTVSGYVNLKALGGSANEWATVPFTADTTWKLITTTLNVNASDHVDLRPSITMSNANSELYLDDQVLQRVYWTPTSAGTAGVQVTSAVHHEGNQALAVTDAGKGSTVQHALSEVGAAGSSLTYTAWIYSPDGVTGKLRILEGSTQTDVPFRGNGTWTAYTVTTTLAGGVKPTLQVITDSGFAGKTLYVDDFEATVTGALSPLSLDDSLPLGAPPDPPGWISGTADWNTCKWCVPIIATDRARIDTTPGVARTGAGALVVASDVSTQSSAAFYVSSITPPEGSVWKASVWLRISNGANSDVHVYLSSGDEETASDTGNWAEADTVATTDYQRVDLTLPIRSDPGPLTLVIGNLNAYGTTVWVDDVSITEDGLSVADPWIPWASGGYMEIEGVDDTATAHDGTGYLSLTNHSQSTGSAYLDDTYRPQVGMTHEMSFWVKGTSDTPVAGSGILHTYDSAGRELDTKSVGFSATSEWQYVYLSLPITNTNGKMLRSEITVPAGVTLYVDDFESRDIESWRAVSPSSGETSIAVIDNAPDPVDGANYLRLRTTGANGGLDDSIIEDLEGDAVSVVAGSSYTFEGYVRATHGTPLTGIVRLSTGAGDDTSVPFSAEADWTPFSLTLVTTKDATSLDPRITLDAAGELDIDGLTLSPELVVQKDPWTASGSGVTMQVRDDPEDAHDSSYGLMEFTASSSGSGITHAITTSTKAGDQLSATAWVRVPANGISASGTLQVSAVDGTEGPWSVPFTATSEWSVWSLPMVMGRDHSALTISLLSTSPGAMIYVDDVALVDNPWRALTSSVTQGVVTDGPGAQSGTGYLSVAAAGTSGGSVYLDMGAPAGGVYAAGSTWTATAYLRSTSATKPATGKIWIGEPGGTLSSTPFSVGTEWTAVPSRAFSFGSHDDTALRIQVELDGSSVPVEIDSVTASDGTELPDGISEPLNTPESGVNYLWDNAFDVPGAHLWALSGQINFEDGIPGLGLAATLYQDPTKLPNVMTGTSWIKGDFAVNFSESDPCFLFDFATTGDSGISIGGNANSSRGVFEANDFYMSFAPRGCQVDPYTLPRGAAIAFDDTLGDAGLHIALSLIEEKDGPTFTGHVAVTNMKLGGIDYKEMALDIELSPTSDSISLAGDMVLPMGNFEGTFDLSVNESDLHMDGSADLSDWQWKTPPTPAGGGGFDVEEMEFDFTMDVPFGAGKCPTGSEASNAHGILDINSKSGVDFNAGLALDCGKLEQLHMDFLYKHSSQTYTFNLDYDSDTHIFAGGLGFDFERKTTWKHVGIKHERHPQFSIAITFSMDVTKPSTAVATIDGEVSVADGDGDLKCQFNPGSSSSWADDSCHLHVHIDILGGHTYDAEW